MNILGFILPCKSDCQPIFLENARHILTLRNIVTFKNIPDSFHRYGSNVTFGASLAFHMRKEYVFEKRVFENWTSRGVNSGVTQFHAQFTHISRQFWALNRKQKNCFGKTVLKMLSQICGKNPMLANKVTLKKVQKSRHIKSFFSKSETTFSKQFSLNYFFVFYSKLNTV